MSADEVYSGVCRWAKEYDPEFADLLADREFAVSVFSIGRGGKSPARTSQIGAALKHTRASSTISISKSKTHTPRISPVKT